MNPRLSATARDPHLERDTGLGLGAAIAVHALLIAGLVFVVQWKSEPPAAVYAELWAPGAAPAAPVEAPPPPPPPPPKAAPEPEPEKPADIVVKTEPKKPEPKKPEPKPEPKKPEPKKPEPKPEPKKPEPKKPEPKPEPKPDPKAAEREAKAAEARHKAELARVMGQSSSAAPGGSPNAVPGAGLSGSAAATYAGQVIGCVRPHIVFAVPDGARRGQFVANFSVRLLPTGEQVGAPKLVKPSGLAAYDAAVERAIRRCDPFPSPKGGTPPREVLLQFDPVELR